MELVEEETTEIPSYFVDHSDEENESIKSDFSDMMFDISEKNISGLESYSDVSTHLPTWAKKTLSSVGTNIGNPASPRRTRSNFQRVDIYLSFHDSLMYETCYLMIGSNPNSYYHAQKYSRWKAAMDKEFNSLRKNATWELVSLTPRRKLVQCKWVFRTKFVVDGIT